MEQSMSLIVLMIVFKPFETRAPNIIIVVDFTNHESLKSPLCVPVSTMHTISCSYVFSLVPGQAPRRDGPGDEATMYYIISLSILFFKLVHWHFNLANYFCTNPFPCW